MAEKSQKKLPVSIIHVTIGDMYLSSSIPFFFLTFLYMGFSRIRDPGLIVHSIIFFIIAIFISAVGINKKSSELHGVSAGRYFFSAITKKS